MDVSNITVNTQSSIRIVTAAGKVIYVDPLEIPEAKNDADYIFVTHDHYDHCSMKDIRNLSAENTAFIIPVPLEKKFRNDYKKVFGEALDDKIIDAKTSKDKLLTVKPGKSYETSDFSFETVASYNIAKPFHPKRAGWVGYILVVDGTRIYIAGDTDATKEAKRVSCDVAMIPIGGTFTMNYKQAADLINEMKPQCVIPTHYGSIVGNVSDGDDFKKLVNEDIQVELKL